MKIISSSSGTRLDIALEGRLDTVTAPQLEKALGGLDGVTALTLDLAGLEYISSAGLRLLLFAHKRLADREGMKVTNANEIVREVFDVTGVADILTIE